MSDYQVTNYGICGECRWIGHDYDSDDWECRHEDSEKYRCLVDWLYTCEEWEQNCPSCGAKMKEGYDE